MTQAFYKSKAWKRKRAKILRRDEYMCQQSKRYGKTEPASPVHHIYPLEEYPELALEDWNLISLSEKQHNAMHDRVTHELTALGLEWQERVRPHYERWMKEHEGGDEKEQESAMGRFLLLMVQLEAMK